MNKEIAKELLYEIDTKICTPLMRGEPVDINIVMKSLGNNGISDIFVYITDLEQDVEYFERKLEDSVRNAIYKDDDISDLKWSVGVLLDKLEDVLDEMGEECIDTSRIDDIVEEIRQEIS